MIIPVSYTHLDVYKRQLLLSSGNVMAVQANPDKSFGGTEQLQSITISGLVVDAAGEPIIGASVVEKGTTNGGITDLDGKFTLTITPGATLKDVSKRQHYPDSPGRTDRALSCRNHLLKIFPDNRPY